MMSLKLILYCSELYSVDLIAAHSDREIPMLELEVQISHFIRTSGSACLPDSGVVHLLASSSDRLEKRARNTAREPPRIL